MEFYQTSDGFLGKILVNESGKATQKTPFIIILDISGSMCHHASRMANQILPKALSSLNYDLSDLITFITFTCKSEKKCLKISDLARYEIGHQGGTSMAGVMPLLSGQLCVTQGSHVRILTISDGEIFDQKETQDAAQSVKETVDKMGLKVSSQSIRLFTSNYGQPDTRALCSLLQLNNSNTLFSIVDINANDSIEAIASEIVKLFDNDGFSFGTVDLCCGKAIMKLEPWKASGTNKVQLSAGQNFIWFDELPEQPLTLDGKIVEMNMNVNSLSRDEYAMLVNAKMEAFLQKIKLLKVINTDNSRAELQEITSYFNKMAVWCVSLPESVDELGSKFDELKLKDRLKILKRNVNKQKKALDLLFAEIANNDRVEKLNASQQAEYLRSASGKTAKGLARRAMACDNQLDFDAIVRQEVRMMHSNIHELNGIDDSNHRVSFISQETTLEGIKTVCALVDDESIEMASALEILLLFNIVGVPCEAPVGDYPDPMTWRLNDIHFDCHVSVADLLVAAKEKSNNIYTPGSKRPIVNAIPIFDDLRILNFLMKHAPTMMEYLASLGMRRMISYVPYTFGSSIANSCYKMIEILNKDKSTVKIETFLMLVDQLSIVMKSNCRKLVPFLTAESNNSTMAFDIGTYFGVSHLIAPLSECLTNDSLKELPRILRSTYSYELWNIIRKRFKTEDRNEVMKKLLNLDLEKYGIPLQEYFVEEPNDPYSTFSYDRNIAFAQEVFSDFSKIELLAVLPEYLAVANSKTLNINEKIERIKQIDENSDELVCSKLEISDLPFFRFINVFQALHYFTLDSRIADVDLDTRKVTFPDPGCFSAIEKVLYNKAKSFYANDYSVRVKEKKQKEIEILSNELAMLMLNETSFDKFLKLFKEGISKGCRSFKFSDAYQVGVNLLIESLLQSEKIYPHHAQKLIVLVTGKYLDEEIWNKGNGIRVTDTSLVERLLVDLNREDLIEYYLANRCNIHHYRELPNRHSHSNDKPSYWAMGFANLQDLKNSVSLQTWEEYKALHIGCCGLN
ncbi:hypothetical protein O9G_005015 [Rozella allomycis CSF55]|uniref:VWFA domain-containing protein n=1 Tax=Rozella allomycis (strain CSF55) TaxID=988480 RepID=A0A075B3M2_ROZAC|nr:hypothetical protein O9G_005015 [Rozella allomycis CSF55]|eukprot:EPZ35478.1 hypothetical protein O9G_005015 [Rozella allomycis CSF55]